VAQVHVNNGALTHPGQVRTSNEDAFLVEGHLFVVADGMGGHNAGEVASEMAVESLRRAAANIVDEATLSTALQQANEEIHTESMMNHVRHGMGTTIAALAVTNNDTVLVANVGDARIYRWHEGNLSRVTKDHSYVQELVDEGVITLEEARVHPRRNIVTRALGIDTQVEISTATLPITIGARYVLCSDGLVDEVTDSEISAILSRYENSTAAAEALISAANSAGGRDNITVIVVDVSDKPVARVGGSSGEDALSGSTSSSLRVAERSSEVSPAPVHSSSNLILPKARVGLSLGFILFWTALAAIVLSVLIVFAAYGRTGYFVGFEGSDVVIYKGRPGGVLWFDPTVEARTPLKERDLTEDMAKEILGNPTFGDAVSAQRYVNGIRDEVQPVPTTTLPLPVTTTSSSTTTSTTSTVPESTTTTLGS
jgi:serine/threonine protein phosphatase PrpC